MAQDTEFCFAYSRIARQWVRIMFKVSMDEAGNTGENLLDQSQPVFALASIGIDSGRAEAIVDEALSNSQAPELHFARLQRSKRGRSLLTRVLQELHQLEVARLSIQHKPYSALGNLVDLLIEPLMHCLGYDLYSHGNNVSFVDFNWWSLMATCGEAQAYTLLQSFFELARVRTEDSAEQFARVFEQTRQSSSSPEHVLIFEFPLDDAETVLSSVRNAADFHLDPALSNFVVHCATWGIEADQLIEVEHDSSNVLAYQRSFFQELIKQSMDTTHIGYGERSLTLPLPVQSLRFVDSSDSAAVQLADVLASAASYVGRSRVGGGTDEFAGHLEELFEASIINAVWPGQPLPIISGPDPSGSNPADAMAEFLRQTRDSDRRRLGS